MKSFLIAILLISSTFALPKNVVDIIAKRNDTSTLLSVAGGYPAIVSALTNTGAQLTLFAPDNLAFTNLPADNSTGRYPDVPSTLEYHVLAERYDADQFVFDRTYQTLQGSTLRFNDYSQKFGFNNVVTINGVRVIAANLESDNGVVHVLDKEVLYPAPGAVPAVAASAGFSTLLTAVGASSELVQKFIADKDGITVFAPTNEAFAKLDDLLKKKYHSSLAELLKDQLLLDAILSYHTVPFSIWSAALRDGKTEVQTSLFGDTFEIDVTSSGVSITDKAGRTGKITAVDVEATNGVIHVIDEVLLPRNPRVLARLLLNK